MIKEFLNFYSELALDKNRNTSENIILTLSYYLGEKIKSEQSLNKLSENIFNSYINQSIINRYNGLKILGIIFNNKLKMRYNIVFQKINFYIYKKFINDNQRKKKNINEKVQYKPKPNNNIINYENNKNDNVQLIDNKKIQKNENIHRYNSCQKFNKNNNEPEKQNIIIKKQIQRPYDLSRLYPFQPLINENSRKMCHSKYKDKIEREKNLLCYPFISSDFTKFKKPKEYKILSQITSRRNLTSKSPKKKAKKVFNPNHTKEKEKILEFSEKIRKQNSDKDKDKNNKMNENKKNEKDKINANDKENEENEKIDKTKINENEKNKDKDINKINDKENIIEKDKDNINDKVNEDNKINNSKKENDKPKNDNEFENNKLKDNENQNINIYTNNPDNKEEEKIADNKPFNEKESIRSGPIDIQESSISMSLNLERRRAEFEAINPLRVNFESKALNQLQTNNN